MFEVREGRTPRPSLIDIVFSVFIFFSRYTEFMKELILFSFVILFIACQKFPDPTPNAQNVDSTATEIYFAKALATSMTCDPSENLDLRDLDLLEELQNPAFAGFYYRPTEMRSENQTSEISSELVCFSDSTDLPEKNNLSLGSFLPDSNLTRSEKSMTPEAASARPNEAFLRILAGKQDVAKNTCLFARHAL